MDADRTAMQVVVQQVGEDKVESESATKTILSYISKLQEVGEKADDDRKRMLAIFSAMAADLKEKRAQLVSPKKRSQLAEGTGARPQLPGECRNVPQFTPVAGIRARAAACRCDCRQRRPQAQPVTCDSASSPDIAVGARRCCGDFADPGAQQIVPMLRNLAIA